MSSKRLFAKHRSTDLERTQCPNCLRSKTTDSISLFRCKGCTQTCYCGTKCQKAHWKKHKPICQERQETHRYPHYHDIVYMSSSEPPVDMRFKPSGLSSEVTEFQNHYKRLIYTAALSGFNVFQKPDSWRNHFLWIKVVRAKGVLLASHHSSAWWSRYMIADVEVVPLTVRNLETNSAFTKVEAQDVCRRKKAEDMAFRGFSKPGTSGLFWVSTQLYVGADELPTPGFLIERDCTIAFNLTDKSQQEYDPDWKETLIRNVNDNVAKQWSNDLEGALVIVQSWRHMNFRMD